MCGIIGVYGNDDAASMAYYGLYAMIHRGQDGAGIAASDGHEVKVIRSPENVTGFSEVDVESIRGRIAMGQNRYPTFGPKNLINVQPIVNYGKHGQVAICHNGQFTNAKELRDELVSNGAVFQTTTDTEVFLHAYVRSTAENMNDALMEAAQTVEGAFSLILMTKDTLVAMRDRHGIRPLSVGRLDNTWVIASETCAFDLLGADYIRELEPGEILVINQHGAQTLWPFPPTQQAHCIFEHVYFSRPDSFVFGRSVSEIRTQFGRELAREKPVDADIVVAVLDSGLCAAMGYAEESKIPLRLGLIRNHYVGRTFIQSHQGIRDLSVKVKLNADRNVLAGKRVILVDDSIVRGTTSKKIVQMVRDAGATEVHLRISCPPTISSCYYGVDTRRPNELIAANYTLDEIKQFIGVESIGYLSHEKLLDVIGDERNDYCTSCYTGVYPLPIPSDAYPLTLVP